MCGNGIRCLAKFLRQLEGEAVAILLQWKTQTSHSFLPRLNWRWP